MKTLLIIPAYNESGNIEKVIDNIQDNFPQYDYVIINDCSTDNTEEICSRRKYNYVTLPHNLGIGGGVQTGYKYALRNNYDYAVQMDGDGQHNPEFLKDLLAPLKDGTADIAIGSRFITKEGFQSSGARRMGIKLLSFLIKLCSGTKINDVTSGFRAVNKKFIEFYSKEYSDDYPEPEAIVSASINGGRIVEVPVIMNEREHGKSSISSLKSVTYMIKVSIAILTHKILYGGKK